MALKKSNGNDVAKVVEEIENENLATLNPISTDEDGIIRDEELLAGYIDEDGILHHTFSYREMNGKDEEAINKGDVRSNGGKLANILLERCIIEIGTLTKKECGPKKWGDIIRNMLDGDLDYMLLKLRELSKGNEITFTHKCPNCKTKLTTTITTDELNIKEFNGEREIAFELPRGYKDKNGVHKKGMIRRMNGYDREIIVPLAKKNGAIATTMLLTRLVKFDDGAFVTNEGIANLSLRDREYLEDLIKDNVFGVDMTVEATCSNCGEDLTGILGESNFF